MAAALTDEEVSRAGAQRARIVSLLSGLVGGEQLLVIPTVPGAAPPRAWPVARTEEYRRTAMRLLCIAGLGGLPQVSLPLLSADGAPLGLSLVGPRGSDRALLRAAARLCATAGEGG